MPEVWFPYGAVETLITIQAENLGTMVEPSPELAGGETDRLAELVRSGATLCVGDSNPVTLELIRALPSALGSIEGLRVVADSPRKVESVAPELKGRVAQAQKVELLGGATEMPGGGGRRVFVATARPDPLFGIVDARVQAALTWISGAQRESASARKEYEPTPFEKTQSYDRAVELASRFKGASFLTLIPRGGRIRSVLEDAPFDAVKNGFMDSPLPTAKGLIVGAGGKGYDDTFSSALRSIWGALSGVRRSGEVLIVSECSGGLGSTALDMLASGRIAGEGEPRKERYVDGLEEVHYLSMLKEEYNVLLLSGLPELFAKGKLGLSTARGSGEAVGRLLNKLGRTAKVNVVTRAAELRVAPA